MVPGFEVEVVHATARSSAAGYRCNRLAHRSAPADERWVVPVIGFLGSGSAAAWQGALPPVRQGLSETGFTEGKNIVIEYRWADEALST